MVNFIRLFIVNGMHFFRYHSLPGWCTLKKSNFSNKIFFINLNLERKSNLFRFILLYKCFCLSFELNFRSPTNFNSTYRIKCNSLIKINVHNYISVSLFHFIIIFCEIQTADPIENSKFSN